MRRKIRHANNTLTIYMCNFQILYSLDSNISAKFLAKDKLAEYGKRDHQKSQIMRFFDKFEVEKQLLLVVDSRAVQCLCC